jgi:hypothetical protein
MKAQIKMFETIGVLIVFFVMLSGGTVFYFNLQESAVEKELAQQARLRGLQVAQRALYLPELECSYAGVPEQNCIDKHKLQAFSRILEQDSRLQESLFGFFGDATLNVTIIYPATQTFFLVIYDRPPEQYKRKLVYQSPVLVRDPITRKASFGVMEVTTYATN